MLFDDFDTNVGADIAVADFTRARSWAELRDNIEKLSHYLVHDLGLQPGDGVAVLMGNRVEFVECLWAGLVSGLWVTPVNTHLVAEEIAYIVENSGVQLVICDLSHRPLLADSDQVAVLCIESHWPAIQAGERSALELSSVAGGTMLYTSGTSGRPKGVRRHKPDTVADLLTLFRSTGERFGLDGSGPHLITGPLYHAAPMLFGMYDLINGAPLYILPHWDTRQFLDVVSRYGICHTHLVPTQFVRLLRQVEAQNRRPLRSLTLVLHGAAPVSPTIKRQMIGWWGEILVEYWGGTEAGVSTLVDSAQWLDRPGTVGRPLAHLEVFAAGASLEPLPPFEQGPLYCRHKSLAQVFSYHSDPAKTAAAHPAPGLFCIGDIGYVDEQGFVFLSDRQSNVIISGGVNIYPAEIEHVLLDHPAVSDIAVVGRPHDDWGEQVVAIVQLHDQGGAGGSLVESLTAFARRHLAAYKVPKAIEFVACLPRTPTGKLRLGELRG